MDCHLELWAKINPSWVVLSGHFYHSNMKQNLGTQAHTHMHMYGTHTCHTHTLSKSTQLTWNQVMLPAMNQWNSSSLDFYLTIRSIWVVINDSWYSGECKRIKYISRFQLVLTVPETEYSPYWVLSAIVITHARYLEWLAIEVSYYPHPITRTGGHPEKPWFPEGFHE